MSKRRNAVGLVAAVGGGVVGVVLVGSILHQGGPNASALAATVQGTVQTRTGTMSSHAYLKLATYPDSMAGEHGADGGAHPGLGQLRPSTNLHVPAHSLVTVTIDQYDGGEKITNPYFAKVHGTVDGTMTVDGKTGDRHRPRRRRPHLHDPRAHPATRTRCSSASRSRPSPTTRRPAADTGYPTRPHVVVFSFVTGGPGKYVWNCEFPCGDGYYAKFGGPMSTRGYMSGTLTVA